MPRKTTATELHERLKDGAELFLLDVREPWEVALCRIPGSVNIPMGEIPDRYAEIPDHCPVVCICHHGMRSEQVALYLERQRENGEVENLQGGVHAWATQVDPAMQRY